MITGKLSLLMALMILFLNASTARAEKFDEFLDSLDKRLPIDTSFMKLVLKKSKTKLAHPSLLEKWGLVNQEAAASYNGFLDTVVLKEEYTVEYINEQGKKDTRLKTVKELKKSEPLTWSVRLATIFHELSHAEYSWLSRSTDPVDKELIQFLKTEFDDYLKLKQPQYSATERKIARSELFAYYRDEFISRLITTIDDLLLENGYFKTSRTCKNTKYVVNLINAHPITRAHEFLTSDANIEFANASIPIIYVHGKEAVIDPNDPIYPKLQKVLWAQLLKHYAPAASKHEIIKWMNTKSHLADLIKPCRQEIVKKHTLENESR